MFGLFKRKQEQSPEEPQVYDIQYVCRKRSDSGIWTTNITDGGSAENAAILASFLHREADRLIESAAQRTKDGDLSLKAAVSEDDGIVSDYVKNMMRDTFDVVLRRRGRPKKSL